MPEIYLAAPSRLIVFILVLTRIGGLVMTAPVLGTRAAPARVRGLLAVGLALLVLPLQMQAFVEPPSTLAGLLVLMIGEAIIGLTLGLGVMILFSGVQLTGQIVGQMSGAQIADIFDPTFNQSVPIYAQLLDLVTVTVFVLIGGHREVVDALLGTFRSIPIGSGGFNQGVGEAMLEVLTQSFIVGIRAAAPAIVALLMSVLVLGLVSRTLPQLNILAVGFSLNAMVMLGVVALSLGSIAWVFQDEVGPTLDVLRAALAQESK